MKIHSCSECRHPHARSLTVDGVLVVRREVLLIKRGRNPFKGYWALPGGHVEFGETVEEACIREFREETGVVAEIKSFLGLYSRPSRHPLQAIAVAYIVRRISGIQMAGDDAEKLAWFSLDSLPKKLAFDHQLILVDYFKKIKNRS